MDTTPKPTKQNGKPCFTIDARSEGIGRIFGPTKDACLARYRQRVKESIIGATMEFTPEDRQAKMELGENGTLIQAVRFYLARVQTKQKKTVTAAGAEWCAEMRTQNISNAFVKICEVVMRAFKTYLDDETGLVSDITPEKITRFLTAKNSSTGYKNTMRARLSQFFTFCERNHYVAAHPIKGGKVQKFRESRGRKAPRIFTVQECRSLLNAAQEKFPCMLPYLALGLFCGVRPDRDSEMGRLVGTDVHLKAGVLEIADGTSKCGPGRTVRLIQTVSRLVEQVDGSTIDKPMVYSPALAWLVAAPKPLTIVCTDHYRRALAKAAGVKWSPDVMRHTFASNHFYAFSNGTDTSEQMGHNGGLKMLKRHYLNRAAEKDALAFWSLMPEPNIQIMPSAAAA